LTFSAHDGGDSCREKRWNVLSHRLRDLEESDDDSGGSNLVIVFHSVLMILPWSVCAAAEFKHFGGGL